MNKKQIIFLTNAKFILIPTMGQGNKVKVISFTPIGILYTGYSQETGDTYQGILNPYPVP
jgi:hypothetical protein